MLSGLLAVIGERLSSAIEQAGELLTSRTGFVGAFIMNESGRVNPEQGFRFAWTGGLLLAGAVFLGTPNPSPACPQGPECSSKADCEGYCRGASNNQCSGTCSNSGICYCTG